MFTSIATVRRISDLIAKLRPLAVRFPLVGIWMRHNYTRTTETKMIRNYVAFKRGTRVLVGIGLFYARRLSAIALMAWEDKQTSKVMLYCETKQTHFYNLMAKTRTIPICIFFSLFLMSGNDISLLHLPIISIHFFVRNSRSKFSLS